MTLYKNKYRIESARLKNWDYANTGYYFITICTKNRENYFGEIINNKMYPSEIGDIVEQYWQEIPTHFPFAILDKYIIMPNHIHGIITIKNKKPSVLPETFVNNVETLQCNVSTKRNKPSMKMSQISPNAGSLATIIRSYKSICTRTLNEKYPGRCFAWQPRFHDHVIRNNDELSRIRLYIVNNPKNWQNDRNNVK